MLVNYIDRIDPLVTAPVITGLTIGPINSFAGTIVIAGAVLLIDMAPI